MTSRLRFLPGLVLCFSIASAWSQPLAPVPFTQVRFTDSFWAPRLETNRTVTIPHAFRMCEQTGRIDNFAKAAGRMPGEFRGIFYDDSDVYKAIEGASYSLATHPDPALDTYLDNLISTIAAAQRPDGYLNTYYTLKGGLEHRYSQENQMHELYCAGHLMEAAVAHHRATGKTALLDVAVRFADEIGTVFGPTLRHEAPGHEEIELALVKLSGETGNPKYRGLAEFFVECRGNLQGRDKLNGPYMQDHKPVIEQIAPVGHAVRQMYLLCGVTDLLPDHPAYQDTLDQMWDNLVFKRMYVTGGVGARPQGEAFGDDYELPNDTAYAETCAAIGNALWQSRMNLEKSDGRYFDVFEQVLYNGLISGVSLAGDKFFYVNPLASSGNHHRQAWYGTACCPVNVARFLPSLPGYVYATKQGGPGERLYVNLYAASQATVQFGPQAIRITQETDYPWDGRIRITLHGDQPFAGQVALRIPAWCHQPQVTAHGQPAVTAAPDHGYAILDGPWKDGEVIELALPMEPERLHASTRVQADAGRVAIRRGPLVYCAEAVDNAGRRVSSLCLPPEAPISTETDAKLLGGRIVTLRARGLTRTLNATDPADLTLIPYYAWDHRAPGSMAVWVAEDPAVALPMTLAASAVPTASHINDTDTLDALADQRPIAASDDLSIPRFTWWDHRGSAEWVQYDFPKLVAISSARVYFFDDHAKGGQCRPPASWRLLYQDGDAWKPIATSYPSATDQFNVIAFDQIKTRSLRLEAQLQPGFSAGILEWEVK